MRFSHRRQPSLTGLSVSFFKQR
uniref:Uncharacterized protein n=1 Tax=Rhizophora mucronata TaxID=61149 RepID=A0A2P2JXW5_RHIMU